MHRKRERARMHANNALDRGGGVACVALKIQLKLTDRRLMRRICSIKIVYRKIENTLNSKIKFSIYRKQCGQAVLDVLKEQPIEDILQHIRPIASTISMAAEDTGNDCFSFVYFFIFRVVLTSPSFIVRFEKAVKWKCKQLKKSNWEILCVYL